MGKKVIGMVLVLTFLFAGTSLADKRSYVWTYEYMTMLKGKVEAEYYLTPKVPDWDKTSVNSWEHQLEMEYGISDRWDISGYLQFKQKNTKDKSTFDYEGFKLRTRYRFGEKNQYPLDTLLYLEYKRPSDLTKPNVFEGKVIFAKDIGKLNLAYNQIIEIKTDMEEKVEHEYAAGMSYEIFPRFRLGVESKGNYTESKYYVGPTIATTLGNRAWIALGAGFGVTKKSDDLQARLIVGVLF